MILNIARQFCSPRLHGLTTVTVVLGLWLERRVRVCLLKCLLHWGTPDRLYLRQPLVIRIFVFMRED